MILVLVPGALNDRARARPHCVASLNRRQKSPSHTAPDVPAPPFLGSWDLYAGLRVHIQGEARDRNSPKQAQKFGFIDTFPGHARNDDTPYALRRRRLAPYGEPTT